MLVFISDLHFVDGTAGEHNLPPSAFEKFFTRIRAEAENVAIYKLTSKSLDRLQQNISPEIHKILEEGLKDQEFKSKNKFEDAITELLEEKKAQPISYEHKELILRHAKKQSNLKEIKFILLGDIFDLLRTTKWFEMTDVKDRPWGGAITDSMREKAMEIFNVIAQHHRNKETFKYFRTIKERFFKDMDIEVETIYIPGNHDRLCWGIDELKDECVEHLGLKSKNKPNFQTCFQDETYGVYAMHGHFFDPYNYGGIQSRIIDEDYECMPIGDPITTELIAKLPYQLREDIKNTCWGQEQENLIRNFQEIENVRPFSATLKWLYSEVEKIEKVEKDEKSGEELKKIINNTVKNVAKNFPKQAYDKAYQPPNKISPECSLPVKFKFWCKRVGKSLSLSIILVFWALPFSIRLKFNVFNLLKKLKELLTRDPETQLMRKITKFLSKNNIPKEIQYIVMGHTHESSKRAITLKRNQKGDPPRELVYLNTGTWRKNYHECKDKTGFIGWKDMTYVIIYKPEEQPNQHNLPVFESWSGSLKREEIQSKPPQNAMEK